MSMTFEAQGKLDPISNSANLAMLTPVTVAWLSKQVVQLRLLRYTKR
jgi:hypothetical protein